MDFQPLSTGLNFSSSTDVSCANITIFDDQTLENDETFTVQLSSSDPNVIITIPQSVVIILNDDSE